MGLSPQLQRCCGKLYKIITAISIPVALGYLLWGSRYFNRISSGKVRLGPLRFFVRISNSADDAKHDTYCINPITYIEGKQMQCLSETEAQRSL